MALKNCKDCGAEISGSAKACPKCGKDPRNFFMKHKIITFILIVIALGVIGSQLGGSDESTTTGGKSNVKEVYAFNEEATLEGASVTVTNVERSDGNEWDNPKTGEEFLIVTVQIKNTSDKNISYNYWDYKVQDGSGNIESMTFSTINNDTSLNSGELASGGTKTGTIIFETPKGDTDLTLIYEGNFWTGSQLKFKLQ